ncbi:MAG TPA: hypothetical protein VIL07_11415 [Symbiobacteriaceae bacterium]
MALKVGLGKDTPPEAEFPVLNVASHGCLVHFTPVPFEMDEPEEVLAYASVHAVALLRFLYDNLDPFVREAFLRAAQEVANERFGPPEPVERVVERIVEVPVMFRITDPEHPYHGRTGEMLYCENDEVWYLWIDEKPVRVVAGQIEKVPPASRAGGDAHE